MDGKSNEGPQSTLLGSVWRYRWLALVTVLLFVAAGLLYAITRPVAYAASASLVIEDPRASTLFGSLTGVSPIRYLAEQVAMMSSGAVAEEAASLASDQGFPDLDTEAILEGTEISAGGDSNFVAITFTSSDAERAVVGANAVADAYQETRRAEALNSAVDALRELDDKIAAIGDDLIEIQERIDELRSASQGSDLDTSYRQAVRRLGELYLVAGLTGLSEEQRSELDDIVDRIDTLRLLSSIELGTPDVAALLREQSAAIDRRSSLQFRRDEIEVDAALASGGVGLYSPAVAAIERGGDVERTLAVSLVLGGLVAVGVPALLDSRDKGFVNRQEPEPVLKAPLLAEIPNFRGERITSSVPVRDVPRSRAAEGYRFAVTGVEFRLSTGKGPLPLSSSLDGSRRSVLVCSGAVGDGKTTVCANLAWVAARRGSRVLAIDADFGNQKLTEYLEVEKPKKLGLTDIVENDVQLPKAIQTVKLDEKVHLDLLSRGSVPVNTPDFFRSAGVRTFFDAIQLQYDLIVIDSPPLLQVAYSSLIARYVDTALVVVKHGSRKALLQEVADRLDLVGTPILGYLYNQAPLRQELSHTDGSMADVLGSA